MRAQQLMVDTIANNLANVNTTGFKRSRVSFEDVLYETLEQPRTVNPNDSQTIAPVQIGKGVRLGAITRLHTQGAPEQTGRLLDVAIQGDGFFQVEKPDGTTAYTRDGSFGVSDTGALVTNDGYRVLPNVTLPQDVQDVSISPSGLVQANNGSGQPVELGRIELARFVNPSGLMSLGENLYAETAASGQPVTGFPQELGFGKLMQGYLESSNVEIVQEMTDMIAAQRAYEINAKAIRAGEDMMQATNDLIR
jgi:flagellar basal-body rod protein FlgG